jgi:flagellar motor switch protein FliM
VRIGDTVGMMNIAIPSIVIKMMRQKFDQQWSVRKAQSTEAEQNRIARLVDSARIHLEARLIGPTLRVEDFMHLAEGDVLTFDHTIERPLDCFVNGIQKYRGQVVTTGNLICRIYRAR